MANHSFSRVPHADIPRSSFDRSHGHKTTLDAGFLVPILVDEALPGDTYSVNMTGFARLATPMKPIMDNAYFNTFFFAVPIRLIWENWERMNGAQSDPEDSTDYLVPQVGPPAGPEGWGAHSLADYFGLPTGVPGLSVSALPFRAYNLIWNEWFRDQNLQTRLAQPKGDTADDPTFYNIVRRGKRHDYFTSSLPWPQKGESVTIPVGLTANIVPTGFPPTFEGVGIPGGSTISTGVGSNSVFVAGLAAASGDMTWRDPQLQADLTEATGATINQLRQAFAVQRLYERDARGGTRYTEIVRSHFGVTSPDARLQRPEYLGGGQSPLSIHQVAQTQSSPVDPQAFIPQGNLSAYGTASLHRHGFTKAFTEHCIIIGMVAVRADLNYQQGINRMWKRRARFDFYWPALSHIGEQAVLSQEIYADGTPEDLSIWGYQERYAEYRYKPSMITGKLRSTDPQSLDVWHLAQDFATRPLLNGQFIADQPPFKRISAVPSEPDFIADFHFKMRCARPMPVYGVPGMIDHF